MIVARMQPAHQEQPGRGNSMVSWLNEILVLKLRVNIRYGMVMVLGRGGGFGYWLLAFGTIDLRNNFFILDTPNYDH